MEHITKMRDVVKQEPYTEQIMRMRDVVKQEPYTEQVSTLLSQHTAIAAYSYCSILILLEMTR